VLRALADETRLRLLESLLLADKCVSDLVREMGRTQPHVSHHLRILREAGLIEGIRDGKRICYRISPVVARAVKQDRRQTLDFGCCQISFPETVLAAHVG
jgi:ArsR family transcriptional regulator